MAFRNDYGILVFGDSGSDYLLLDPLRPYLRIYSNTILRILLHPSFAQFNSGSNGETFWQLRMADDPLDGYFALLSNFGLVKRLEMSFSNGIVVRDASDAVKRQITETAVTINGGTVTMDDTVTFTADNMQHATRIDLTAPTVAISDRLEVDGRVVCTSEISDSGACTADTHTTTGAKKVANSATRAFVKHYGATTTELMLTVNLTAFLTVAANTVIGLGMLIDGTYQEVTQLLIVPLSQHVQISGVRRLTGTAAVSFNTEMRWRRVSGTGTLNIDTNDRFSWRVEEIAIQ